MNSYLKKGYFDGKEVKERKIKIKKKIRQIGCDKIDLKDIEISWKDKL